MRARASAAVLVALLLLVPAAEAGKPKRQPWQPDVAAAERYAKHRAGEVAFAVIDQRGRFRGYRVRDTAPAASVFKVMLLASLLLRRKLALADNPPAGLSIVTAYAPAAAFVPIGKLSANFPSASVER